jgi:hypothetical protein
MIELRKRCAGLAVNAERPSSVGSGDLCQDPRQKARRAVTGDYRQPNRRLRRDATRQSIVERHENLSCFCMG